MNFSLVALISALVGIAYFVVRLIVKNWYECERLPKEESLFVLESGVITLCMQETYKYSCAKIATVIAKRMKQNHNFKINIEGIIYEVKSRKSCYSKFGEYKCLGNTSKVDSLENTIKRLLNNYRKRRIEEIDETDYLIFSGKLSEVSNALNLNPYIMTAWLFWGYEKDYRKKMKKRWLSMYLEGITTSTFNRITRDMYETENNRTPKLIA